MMLGFQLLLQYLLCDRLITLIKPLFFVPRARRDQHRQQRANRTAEQIDADRRLNAAQHAAQRARPLPRSHNAFRQPEPGRTAASAVLHKLRPPRNEPNDATKGRTPCSFCHALNWLEEKTSNSTLVHPRFTICCMSGQVQLEFPEDLPEAYRALLEGDSADAKHLQKEIRAYNSVLSLASSSANVQPHTAGGLASFTVNGRVNHRMGPLLPRDGAQPAFAQLYILEPDAEKERRGGIMHGLRPRVLDTLQQMMHDVNPYVQTFKAAAEAAAEQQGGDLPDIRVVINRDNKPTIQHVQPVVPEVAGLIPDGEPQVRAWQQGRLSHMHPT